MDLEQFSKNLDAAEELARCQARSRGLRNALCTAMAASEFDFAMQLCQHYRLDFQETFQSSAGAELAIDLLKKADISSHHSVFLELFHHFPEELRTRALVSLLVQARLTDQPKPVEDVGNFLEFLRHHVDSSMPIPSYAQLQVLSAVDVILTGPFTIRKSVSPRVYEAAITDVLNFPEETAALSEVTLANVMRVLVRGYCLSKWMQSLCDRCCEAFLAAIPTTVKVFQEQQSKLQSLIDLSGTSNGSFRRLKLFSRLAAHTQEPQILSKIFLLDEESLKMLRECKFKSLSDLSHCLAATVKPLRPRKF